MTRQQLQTILKPGITCEISNGKEYGLEEGPQLVKFIGYTTCSWAAEGRRKSPLCFPPKSGSGSCRKCKGYISIELPDGRVTCRCFTNLRNKVIHFRVYDILPSELFEL